MNDSAGPKINVARPLGVALIGAGYIAPWHIAAIKRIRNVRLVGIFDVSQAATQSLSERFGAHAFAHQDEVFNSEVVDCVHVLTPPDSHAELAEKTIMAGKHAFVEKPLALNAKEAMRLDALARNRGVLLGVNHNFLMLPGYERMKGDIAEGVYGPIDSLDAHWRFPLPPLRAGPYAMWMMRRSENVLFEIGAHVFAFVADIAGPAHIGLATLRYPVETPNGVVHFQSWRAEGMSGHAAIRVDISLIEGCEDRSVSLRGVGANGNFDFGADSYMRTRSADEAIVLGPLAAQLRRARQAMSAGVANATRQLVSFNALAPYGLSITRACQSFYSSIQSERPVDRRLSASLAADALAMIEATVKVASPMIARTRRAPSSLNEPKLPEFLVIGGTGFIGRRLVSALTKTGRSVRVLTRSAVECFNNSDGLVQTMRGDLKSESDLLSAMAGVKAVFHLARANETTWQGYLANDIAVTKLIGECCLKTGVRRIVYTGTIDSYQASRRGITITEETPFGNLRNRNLYARSKAACEEALMELAVEKKLPLVVLRPGIVIGAGGPLQHWGIAMWSGPADCKLWGKGDALLPFVSIADCADALILAIDVPGIEGRSFNIVGEPMLSAQDYFDAIARSYGLKMRARPTPIWRYFIVSQAKYWMKRIAGRNPERTSFVDWASRAKFSRFDNRAAKEVLGWRPEIDRDRFIQETIVNADLFGLGRGASS